MSKRRLIAKSLVCAVVLFRAWAANGQTIDPSFRSDIQKLMEVTGSAQLGAQAASLFTGQVLDSLKKAQPSIPDREMALVKQVLDEQFAEAFAGPDSLSEQLVLIYANHFTHDDVRGLLTFYSTELGKKVIATTPVIFQEGAAAGQKWAQSQMPRVTAILQARLRAEGFIK
jgi:hypothetical protein